jgi:transcriptional regulator with GAF, ATPase, and Fis domain
MLQAVATWRTTDFPGWLELIQEIDGITCVLRSARQNSLRDQLAICERELVQQMLTESNGVIRRAARLANEPRTTFIDRMTRLGLRGEKHAA